MKCTRCEAYGRKPKEGKHKVYGPNGIESFVCDDCLKEIQTYTDERIDENETDEEVFD